MDPALRGMNSVVAVCDPEVIVNDSVWTFPTAGLLLCSSAVNDMPARSGCTVRSADRFVTGSSWTV